ncbi:MAG: hypothetical protein IKG36_02745 [Mycoplasmataceae bacterium]|nr:hypothetical protein [Mycoplasmataceae bacterium]
MVKEYKKVTKPSSIGSTYEPDLVNKLSDYSKLIGIDRTKIVSSLIAEALEGRILTNDFIALDRPYYFDFKKLIHEGTVEATTEKPVIEPERIFILKKVPNNLDVKNKKYGTYSYSEDRPSYHKGIYYYSLIQLKKPLENPENIVEASIHVLDNVYFIDFYFLFEFEQESNKIIIHSIEEENLTYEVDPLIYPEVISDIRQQEEDFTKNLVLPNGNVNLFQALDFTEVMISYKLYKDTELDLATDTDEKAKVTYLKGFSEFNEFLNK